MSKVIGHFYAQLTYTQSQDAQRDAVLRGLPAEGKRVVTIQMPADRMVYCDVKPDGQVVYRTAKLFNSASPGVHAIRQLEKHKLAVEDHAAFLLRHIREAELVQFELRKKVEALDAHITALGQDSARAARWCEAASVGGGIMMAIGLDIEQDDVYLEDAHVSALSIWNRISKATLVWAPEFDPETERAMLQEALSHLTEKFTRLHSDGLQRAAQLHQDELDRREEAQRVKKEAAAKEQETHIRSWASKYGSEHLQLSVETDAGDWRNRYNIEVLNAVTPSGFSASTWHEFKKDEPLRNPTLEQLRALKEARGMKGLHFDKGIGFEIISADLVRGQVRDGEDEPADEPYRDYIVLTMDLTFTEGVRRVAKVV